MILRCPPSAEFSRHCVLSGGIPHRLALCLVTRAYSSYIHTLSYISYIPRVRIQSTTVASTIARMCHCATTASHFLYCIQYIKCFPDSWGSEHSPRPGAGVRRMRQASSGASHFGDTRASYATETITGRLPTICCGKIFLKLFVIIFIFIAVLMYTKGQYFFNL